MTEAHIKQKLLSFFEDIASRDNAQMHALHDAFDFILTDNQWLFTLPELYRYLQRRDNSFSRISYTRFRKQLFTCPVNKRIKAYHARIMIADNHYAVDRTTYQMLWSARTEKQTF